jgi:hypothetical protein
MEANATMAVKTKVEEMHMLTGNNSFTRIEKGALMLSVENHGMEKRRIS